MNETEFAIISERVQQFRLTCESIESRLRQIEAIQVSMDKSLALYEVGLHEIKEWARQLEDEQIELKNNRVTSTRYWLSFLISAGALLTSLVILILRTVGG